MVSRCSTRDRRPRRRSVLRAAARLHPDARTVGATVSPDNAASLAFVESYGFFENGGQWDDEDCREMIFETSAWAMATFLSRCAAAVTRGETSSDA